MYGIYICAYINTYCHILCIFFNVHSGQEEILCEKFLIYVVKPEWNLDTWCYKK